MTPETYSPYYADPGTDLVTADSSGPGTAMVPPGYYPQVEQGQGYYPLYGGVGQAPVAPPPAQESFFTRRVGPLPTWGWLLVLAAGGAAYAGYQWWKKNQQGAVRPNDADETPWKPSRGDFARKLESLLAHKKIKSVRVFDDADEALASGIRNPSPLINLRVPRGVRLMQSEDFNELVRAEGLEPVKLDETTIGLVPLEESVRGERWGAYIEALREEGQKV